MERIAFFFVFCRTFSMQSHEECRNYKSLTKNQFKVCLQAPDVTKAAMKGISIALKECQFQVYFVYIFRVFLVSCFFFSTQFQWHRWNCTLTNSKNLLQNGMFLRRFFFHIKTIKKDL